MTCSPETTRGRVAVQVESNADTPVENQPPSDPDTDRPGRRAMSDAEIAAALRQVLHPIKFVEIAKRTGFHPESVRRYMAGQSRIPATFVSKCVVEFELEPSDVLVHGSDSYLAIRVQRSSIADFEQTLGRYILWMMNSDRDPPNVVLPRSLQEVIAMNGESPRTASREPHR